MSTVDAPQLIGTNDLAEKLAHFLASRPAQAEERSKPAVAVLDEVPSALEEALVRIGEKVNLTVFLTRRVEPAAALRQFCEAVHLPKAPLPGRIAGFFLCGANAIFVLRGQWYSVSDDHQILDELSAIGDQAIGLMKVLEEA